MKFRSKLTFIMSLMLLVPAAACGKKSSKDPTPSPSPSHGEPTQQPSSPAAPTSEPVEPTSSPAAPTTEPSSSVPSQEWIDYVEDEHIRLGLEYKGHDFYADGVGEVTLKASIDGDTAHFYPVVKETSSALIKARFYGVDTPESTGVVEPYGKAASNFTKAILKHAAENGTIVVSTPQDDYGKPKADSTGARYVSLIWVNEEKKNADISELRLLNLMLVQNGLSTARNLSDMPSYQQTFIDAEKQAKAFKLKIHSGEPDPDYNYGGYEDTSLLDLKKAAEQSLLDPTYENPYDNKKVRVQGTVAGFANGTMYLESFFTEEQGARSPEGEHAAMNLFCGTAAIPSKYKKQNTYLQLCGIAQYSENFGFQLTGFQGHFPIVEDEATENDAKILIRPDDNTDQFQVRPLEYTPAQLNAVVNSSDPVKKFECLFCLVKLTEPVECNKVYFSESSASECTLYFKGLDFQAHLKDPYHGDPDDTAAVWTKEEDFKGKKFNITGIYTYFQASATSPIRYQFVFNSLSDLVWVKD